MKKVELRGENIYVDEKPFLVCGAEIQYFRIAPADWENVLIAAKAAGVNLVTTYIPWMFHEEEEGNIDLEGRTNPAKNLKNFFELACKHGLYLVARPGPFINSELREGGLPRWLFEKYPQTLSHGADGKYCTGRPCPAEGETLYKQKVFKWYDAVIPLIAKFQNCKTGGVIIFQPDNEISSAWSFGLLNSLYDIETIKTHWPNYLLDIYKDIATLNNHYDCNFAAFNEVPPPRAFPSNIIEKKLSIDWLNFKRRFFSDWAIELSHYAIKLGINVPISFNEPVAGFYNHGDHSGVGARIKELGLNAFTSCHTYSDRLQDWDGCANSTMAVRLNRSSPLNSVALSMEAGAGFYNERYLKSDINWDMLLRNNLIDGLCGSIIYSFVNGNSPVSQTIEGPEYWPRAPLSANGEANKLTGKISSFHRFVKAWEAELASAKCPDELNLAFTPGLRLTDFLGTYPLKEDEISSAPGGELFTAETKIDRGEVAFSHDWLDGYEGVSKQSVKVESSAWRKVREALVLSVRMGLSGRMIDLTNPCCLPSSSTPLIVPNAGCLEAKAFEYLIQYIKQGGKVIFTPMIPQFDIYGNRNNTLVDLLGAELTEMVRPAGGEVLDYGSRTIQTFCNLEVSVHSWISVYKFNKEHKCLASYNGKTVAASIDLGLGKAVVVGFEAVYNNSQCIAFWRNICEKECNITPVASEKNGYFSLFSRIDNSLHFLAVGNAAGTFEKGNITCGGYNFELELQPHEGRILIFNVPVLNGTNSIRYSTSEIIPISAMRDTLELHGAAGTEGKLVFTKMCIVKLNGVVINLIAENDGFSIYYEHTKKPCIITIA